MITTVGPRLYSPNQVTRLGVAVAPLLRARASVLGASVLGASVLVHHAGLGLTTSYSVPYHQVMSPRTFSTTNVARLKDFFPAKETAYIRLTKPTWEHPGFSEADMLAVVPGHRKPATMGDWLAWKFVRFARWGMDLCTGLTPEQQVDMKNPTTSIVANKPLTEAQWLVRLIFLESIAGVPGMVAGMLRHFRSMRLLRRDNGWIESLLEESFNERMHLLTFLKMCEPGWFMKSFLILSQAVYFGLLSTSYLISPKTTHRFVGYIEEEAVHTYTRLLHEIKSGQLTKWSNPNFEAPEIAVSYWKLPEGKRSMYDLILYIRADEAGHRGVNHTLGNLNQAEDPNPFVSEFKADSPMQKPSPLLKPEGYERVEVIG